MSNDLWTVKQTAQHLNLMPATVRKMARAGRIPATKMGWEWRFSPDRIQEWIEQTNGKCLVIVNVPPGTDLFTDGGNYYPPGAELPNGRTFEMGVFIGPPEIADDVAKRYKGLLITGDLR